MVDLSMLSARNIHKKYGEVEVLRGVSMNVQAGEVVSIVGPSGSGKSTLLHILGTLDTPDSGEVLLDGKALQFGREKQLAAFRNRKMGFVFQFHHLLPEFSALENVCIPGWIAGTRKKELETRAMDLMARLGLKGKEQNKPQQLSGGEQQRVAVARALINQPAIVLADEPSGNLDTANAHELHRLFFQLKEEFGQAFLIVTHNQDLASMSDRTLQMKDGVLVS